MNIQLSVGMAPNRRTWPLFDGMDARRDRAGVWRHIEKYIILDGARTLIAVQVTR